MSELIRDKRTTGTILLVLATLFIFFGVIFRCFHITDNDFIFYDEGYYLNYNRQVMFIIANHPPQDFGDFFNAFGAYLRTSLASAKALWFLVVNARVYFVGFHAWYFPRVVSAVSGILTLLILFFFTGRFYENRTVSWLAVVILAVYPSHVFYSRLGLQEALSTLLVLAGFFLYIFPPRFGPRAVLSALAFAAAFFTNYRLIILPVFYLFAEVWLAFCDRRPVNIRKLAWVTVAFFSMVFLIGSLDGGKNTYITFGWMFHQANLAKKQFHLINFFSFPYYIFRLDNWILGALFFGNIYFLYQKRFRVVFPFLCVCLQMLIFSFASEKGARYLCAMTPFIAMSVAYLLYSVFSEQPHNRVAWVMCGLAMISLMYLKSWSVAKSTSDYRAATEFIMSQGRPAGFVSTQNYVQNLYVPDAHKVQPCPSDFEGLFYLASQGYRYLVLCPQAYVSLAENNERFHPRLTSFLEFVRTHIKPVKVYPHFNETLLERFVFDHNEQLLRSIRFLNQARVHRYGELRVYDLSQVVNEALSLMRKVQGRP
ncbi:MAG TPA: hypothetical protein PLB05_04770 [Candidatus Omnitrophota bacterium]|nr:hypothetical protein [Candidatus Omnitrophota bacterium]HPN57064.1 hypothetical protein [Candidatus Omnitrophota bacterium]